MTRPLHSLAPEEIVGLCAAQFGVDVVFEESLPGLAAINVLLRAELGQPDRPRESDHPEQTDAVEQAGDPGQPPARFVLKAEYPSPTMTPAHFDWVCRTQEQARAAGLPIAAQVPARTPFTDPSTGESSGALALVDVDGTPAMVRLHAFLPGQEAAAARSEWYPGLAGALAARMTNALADAPAEPAPVVHPWSFVATGANVLSLCDRINALEAAGQVPQEFGTPLSADLALVRAHAQEFALRQAEPLEVAPVEVVLRERRADGDHAAADVDADGRGGDGALHRDDGPDRRALAVVDVGHDGETPCPRQRGDVAELLLRRRLDRVDVGPQGGVPRPGQRTRVARGRRRRCGRHDRGVGVDPGRHPAHGARV